MFHEKKSKEDILLTRLAGLVIFNKLKDDPAVMSLAEYFREDYLEPEISAAANYSAFVRHILSNGGDFAEYLYRFVMLDDNIFMRKYFSGDAAELLPQLYYELDFIGELAAAVPSADSAVDGVIFPKIKISAINFREEFLKALPDAKKRGVGVFARSSMFKVDSCGEIVPVSSTGCQMLSDLIGYKRERRRIVENTEALLRGKTASDVLLYGDAGTGKSSTVKAIVREFAHEGLRLIELDRSQIMLIPKLIAEIAGEPLKFIIFIDDLTLAPDSPDLCALKNVLEGGTGSDRSNCVIYVTSNHRHLVKESAADRNVAELNVQDNLQGVLGLSARFGLAVTFLAPDRELYLEIVRSLAEEMSVPVTDQLLTGAEAFAIRRNGRSPRCAKQYVELIAADIDPIK